MDARSDETSTGASSFEPVTQWVAGLRQGDQLAAQRLWERFFVRMVGLARRKLDGSAKRIGDEEDVAASAFKSFCLGAQEGRFPRVADREGLWALLMAIVANKSIDHIRRENRQKRGGSPDADAAPRLTAQMLDEIVAAEPTPELAAQIAEEFSGLMGSLEEAGDPLLQQIVLARMEGRETPEIAASVGCTRRTIERKLALVRRLWEKRLQ
ncbi:MAG TPA: ECF-type sigma factor [Pirellulaceae bacterium]|jgi:DNA-directed RNA polymerase specialized sigma24 family protein|nr:ECF-type sigma factor [Pirellulaceae bacterium]